MLWRNSRPKVTAAFPERSSEQFESTSTDHRPALLLSTGQMINPQIAAAAFLDAGIDPSSPPRGHEQ
jgi:hypothetical protein